MGSSNCTVVGQVYANNNGGWGSYGPSAPYAGANSTNKYTWMMQFTTPSFTGVCKKLTINLSAKIQSSYYTTINIRYALLSSDANRDSYKNKLGAIEDSNQISTGIYPTMNLTSAYQHFTLELDLKTLTPDTTYYLILWGSSNGTSTNTLTNMNTAENHIIVIHYDDGLLYIDDGTNLVSHQCYIDNGTGFDLYLPYVDTGTGWDQCL